MDIRRARKPEGVVPPKTPTEEKPPRPAPEVNEAGIAVSLDPDNYDGDTVIAGYMDFLKKHDITEEDIREVLDALLSSDNVSWSLEIFGSIPVAFRVRAAWVDDYILEITDKLSGDDGRVSMARYNNTISECNLAASLIQFRDETYNIETREDLDAARERVRQMPYTLQHALVNKLCVFDRIVAVATSDWAVKNFTTPRKEK